MSEWEIAAMRREAQQIKNDATLSSGEKADRLATIAREITARGGNADGIAPVPEKRSTRTSRAAATRRKS